MSTGRGARGLTRGGGGIGQPAGAGLHSAPWQHAGAPLPPRQLGTPHFQSRSGTLRKEAPKTDSSCSVTPFAHPA